MVAYVETETMSTHEHTSAQTLDNGAIVTVKEESTAYESKFQLGIKSGEYRVLVGITEEELCAVKAQIDLILHGTKPAT